MPEDHSSESSRAADFVREMEALAVKFGVYGLVTIDATMHEWRLGRLEIRLAGSAPEALSPLPGESTQVGPASKLFLELWTLVDRCLSWSNPRFGQCTFFLKDAVVQRIEVTRKVLLPKESGVLDTLLYGRAY